MERAPRVGCSSWTSDAWWGPVYPSGLKDGDRLAWYAKRWDTVEVDSSYYASPSPFLVRRWASVTPDGFLFTLKFPRDLLDPKHAVDPAAVAKFVGTAKLLGPKLGPILLQFPPWVKPGRAEKFLEEILGALEPGPRYSVELRDAGWFHGPTFEALCRRLSDRQVALAWSFLTYVDVPPAVTADFVYLRFIGDHTSIPAEQHGEIRTDRSDAIRTWAERLKRAEIEQGFVYFNNHFAGFAPASVNDFRREFGLAPVEFAPPQRRLGDDFGTGPPGSD